MHPDESLLETMPSTNKTVQFLDIPDADELQRVVDLWENKPAVDAERGLIASFMRHNAGHLLAGDTIAYKLTYYYEMHLLMICHDLKKAGYRAKYQRLRNVSEIADMLFISLPRKGKEEDAMLITELKHYGE